MKFQIGDKVIVLHSEEEGEVVDILNKEMVLVEVRDVRFPAYIDQLDFPYFRQFSGKKLFPEKKEKATIENIPKEKKPGPKVVDGVWLSFLPGFITDEWGDDVVENFKIHLINRTETGYQFHYNVIYSGQSGFDLKNTIYAFNDFYLHDIPFSEFSDNPSFEFEFSLLNPDRNKAEQNFVALKLRPKQLFARLEEMKKRGEATFSFKLFDTWPAPPAKPDFYDLPPMKKTRVVEASRIREHLEPARHEIDLHIERLSDNYKYLDNFQILSLQITTFEKWLDLAIAHRQSSFIVIHGIGSGKLRDEVHEILKHRREVKTFVNQYHPAYGYGATEIFFRYD